MILAVSRNPRKDSNGMIGDFDMVTLEPREKGVAIDGECIYFPIESNGDGSYKQTGHRTYICSYYFSSRELFDMIKTKPIREDATTDETNPVAVINGVAVSVEPGSLVIYKHEI